MQENGGKTAKSFLTFKMLLFHGNKRNNKNKMDVTVTIAITYKIWRAHIRASRLYGQNCLWSTPARYCRIRRTPVPWPRNWRVSSAPRGTLQTLREGACRQVESAQTEEERVSTIIIQYYSGNISVERAGNGGGRRQYLPVCVRISV